MGARGTAGNAAIIMTPARIAHYKAQGWTFKHDEWQNGHNGDWEDDYLVKSPRLKKPFDLHVPFDDPRATEKEMLNREKRAYVAQRIGEDEWGTNRRAVCEAAEAELLKDPEAKTITITVRLK